MLQTAQRSTSYPPNVETVTFRHYDRGEFDGETHEQNIPIEGYSPFFEIITPNSLGSHSQWKSFEHYKSVQAKPASTVGWEVTGGNFVSKTNYYRTVISNPWVGYVRYYPWSYVAEYGDMGRLDSGLPLFYQPRVDGGFVPPPTDLNELVRRANRTMLPLIKAELSLPNFILELKDFKRPVRKLVAIFKNPAIMRGISKLAKGSIKNLSWSQLMRTAAGQYLNYKFNIAPLVSDIAKIHKAIAQTERRINDFITREGKPQNKHFVWTWQEFEDDSDEVTEGGSYSDYFAQGSTCGCYRRVFYEPTVFHAQIQYNYNYTGYQREHARILATLDALGVNLNPAIVWNAIPWSFTVDWIFGVSRFLDDMKVENMKPQINIHRSLWSVRRRRRIIVTKGVRTLVPFNALSQNQLPVVVQSSYRRQVGLPSVSSITSSGLSSEEFSLAAALVIARRRPKRSGA